MLNKGKRIGKGTFSSVYEDLDDSSKVFIVTSDKAKAALAEGMVDSEMLPQLQAVEWNEDGCTTVYHGQRYEKMRAPKQTLNKKAHKIYTLLRKAADKVGFCGHPEASYHAVYEAFETLPDENLKDEMLNILDGFSNYGADVAFEISPRNIAADADGNLILLDCFFYRTDLWKVRSQQRN